MDEEEVRWELGERVLHNGPVVFGGFVFVYAFVIGWKHLMRLPRRLYRAIQKHMRDRPYRAELKRLNAAAMEAPIQRRFLGRYAPAPLDNTARLPGPSVRALSAPPKRLPPPGG